MVLEKIRKGSALVTQLRAHQWTSDAQKKDLVEKFLAQSDLGVEDLAWTATDSVPEIRSAGAALMRKHDPREVFHALVPALRTRSEAARRAVQRFVREVAGPSLGALVVELSKGDDIPGQLAALDLSRDIPPQDAREIYRHALASAVPVLKARALHLLADNPEMAATLNAGQLAVPLLQDDDEAVRLGALAILERNPNEAVVSSVIATIATGSTSVREAAFSALKRLLPHSRTDHTTELLPLLADGHPAVRSGTIALLAGIPADRLARGFVERFSSSYAWVRDRALDSLIEGVSEFVPALLRLTHDPDPKVARSAIETSLLLEDPRAIPVWLPLVKDPDWWSRHAALERLGLYGSGREEVFTAIHEALRDPQVWLSAAAALGDFGDPRGSNTLFTVFKSAQASPEDQVEILDALAKLALKDPRIGPMMTKIATLEGLGVRVREKARHLVGRIEGDAARDAIPTVEVKPQRLSDDALPTAGMFELLADTVAAGASDFHVATGFVPHRRIHGTLERLPMPVMTRERAEQLIKEVVSPEEWKDLEKERQIDVCIKVPGLGRFRANFFSQRGGFDASFRAIPQHIPSLVELGLPPSLAELTRYTQGLVLVTGPAGCGKSTTLAALVNRVNETRKVHVITVEDPIEFVHENKEALVNQRQVPTHTVTFARALKAALREDPDVIMIGEMRDLETIALAISASETGHLVFGTLSTTNAPGTIDRIINSFPAAQQGQIRAMISDSLKAVISQSLLPRRDGRGRVAAFEILRGSPSVAALIRESKTYQLPSTLQTGQALGMCTMDQSLMSLVERGAIDVEVALDRASKKEPFEKIRDEQKEVLV